MATADIEEDLSKRDCGHTLFSRQYIGQLIGKVVKIDGVVKQFISSQTISEDERKSLRDMRVADQKLRHLVTIISDHCNRDDLQVFKTFIDILGDTNNVDISQQLSLIYNERVNYDAIRSELSKQKSLVRDLKNEISRLQRILEEQERHIESLRCENKKLVDHCKVADDQEKISREEKLSLEKHIKKNKEDLLIVEKKMGELTRKKNNLEKQVELKSNVICKRDKEIAEKEREVGEAIKESDSLRLQIDTLQQQHTVKDKKMSKKIEILEDELAEKENTIMKLRKNKTMTREEIENIMEGQEKKIDDLTTMAIKQNDKIDLLTDTVMRALNLQ